MLRWSGQMNKDFIKWLNEYDNLRTNPDGINERWVSSKYDVYGLSWREIADIDVVDYLDQDGNPMKWGQVCSALKKTWKSFSSQQRKEGIYRGDLAFRIVKIQRALGIEESVFPELNQEWVDHELSQEEKELKREEQEESGVEEEEDEDWESW